MMFANKIEEAMRLLRELVAVAREIRDELQARKGLS